MASGILGWILDAYYFFILIFLVDVLAAKFGVSKAAIVWSITVTLATRPLGALLLGAIADRYGRSGPLIACVLFFSIVSAMTPFAASYHAFLILRALYGVGMGGYWGIGASLVMESSPAGSRGLFCGHPAGGLFARVPAGGGGDAGGCSALGVAVGFPWRPDSRYRRLSCWRCWPKNRMRGGSNRASGLREIGRALWGNKAVFLYLVLLMTAITCFRMDRRIFIRIFCKSVHGFSSLAVSNLAILYNVGAIAGALAIGHLSQKIGRRWSILVALGIALAALPAWAFGTTHMVLAAGAFVMQFGVQGVFGVIPAHLNELSPPAVRSLFPGVVYQLGTADWRSFGRDRIRAAAARGLRMGAGGV